MKNLLCGIFVLGSFVSFAQAGMVAWKNPVNGLFSDAGNWIGGSVPGNSDAASFATGSNANYAVTLTGPVTNDNLLISDNLTLDLSGQSYQLTSTDTLNPSVQIGGANATLNLQSTGAPATLSSIDAILAPSLGEKATANLNDPDATWNIVGSLYLGGSETIAGGTAALNISAGTVDIAGSLHIYPGGTINLNGGTLEIDNLPSFIPGSTWNGGPLISGMTWTSGSLVLPNTNLTLAQSVTSFNTPPGTSLTLRNISAAATSNTFNIGGALSIQNLSDAGNTTISATTLTASNITSTGTLNFTKGSINTGVLNGSGTVNISGANLDAQRSTFSGTINISGGSVLFQTFADSGSIHLTGGTLEVTKTLIDQGAIDISGGTLIVPNGLSWTHTQPVTSSAELDNPTLPATLATIPFSGGYKILYTWYGDANGDGVVNGTDLSLIAPLGTTNANWSTGDFNGNGVIDIDDYTLFELGASYGAANISTKLPEPGMLALSVLAPFAIRRVSKKA
jgi:hypothetical protein